MSITGQERKTGDCESHHLTFALPSRQSIKPSSPIYDALTMAFITSKIAVDSNGCWLWQGFVQPISTTTRGLKVGGYGQVSYRGRNQPVHRVVWTITRGAPDASMDVCHSCDVRRCCNPAHLWLGTRKQNLLDMADKKRGNKASKTHCKHGHPLSGDNVRLSNNGRRRSCKECQRIRGLRPDVRAMQTAAQKRRRARLRAERAQVSI